MVRSGTVAWLCRPVDLYGLWYARALALRTAPTMLRAVPMCVIASVILPLVGLGSGASTRRRRSALRRVQCSIVCTLLLGCALTTLINISLLWTISGDGLVVLMTATVTFFSGMIIPLPLFPDWAQPIVRALPFAGLVDLPFRVYTGHIEPVAVPAVLAHQILWTAGLVLAGRWLLSRALRNLVVQGG